MRAGTISIEQAAREKQRLEVPQNGPLPAAAGPGLHPTESAEAERPKVFVECLSPSQLADYQPPPGVVLVGDNHLVRGSVFVIGGAPGVGKSRAAVA
jgi:hypothetical protein